MFKRPDSDIFGTKQIQPVVRIKNDSYVDPNEAFKRKNDENFVKYNQKIGNAARKTFYEGNPEMTKVNQKAKFQEDYHKHRKQMDMTSSIFYQQKCYQKPQSSQTLKQNKMANNNPTQICYGRKDTFKRQICSLPYNQSHMKGNQSQLFNFDQKSQVHDSRKDNPVLIPYQMQWDQHDSIRYQHNKPVQQQIQLKQATLNNLQQTKSNQDIKERTQKQELLNDKTQKNKLNTVKSQKNIKKQQTQNNDVEVRVIKGWDNKYMEGLTKYCKMYGAPMTKFELQTGGKAIIYLKRTKKWESITDWLTKDAKMKLRVMNN